MTSICAVSYSSRYLSSIIFNNDEKIPRDINPGSALPHLVLRVRNVSMTQNSSPCQVHQN